MTGQGTKREDLTQKYAGIGSSQADQNGSRSIKAREDSDSTACEGKKSDDVGGKHQSVPVQRCNLCWGNGRMIYPSPAMPVEERAVSLPHLARLNLNTAGAIKAKHGCKARSKHKIGLSWQPTVQVRMAVFNCTSLGLQDFTPVSTKKKKLGCYC